MSATPLRPKTLTITPSPLGGSYADTPIYWFANDPFLTAFCNALFAQFPQGERFLMRSARLFRDQISDPQLRKDVAAFIGQEAHHANEHEAQSAALAARGVPTDRIDRQVKWLLDAICRVLPPKDQLAVTAALEHYTAMFGRMVLENPRMLEDLHPSMQTLFVWHAIEETEHKAVAFDLYQAVDGSYARLMFAYLWSTSLLALTTAYFQTLLMVNDRSLLRLGSVARGLNWMFGFGQNAGHLRRMLPEFLDFFRPDFHPWQHDNSAQIAQWKNILADLRRAA